MVLTSCQPDFYKLDYVDHLQGRSSNYEFSEKNFETYFISPIYLVVFSFEVAFGGTVEGQYVQARAAENELMEALAAESGVAVKEPVIVAGCRRVVFLLRP